MTNKKNNKFALTTPEPLSFFSRVRMYFFSGILVTAPSALTIYIVWATIKSIDENVMSLIPEKYHINQYLPYDIPGFGIIIAFIVFTFIGAFAAGFLGRIMVRTGENLVNRMPVVRNLYRAVKQIFEAVFKRDKNSFREVVLVEYPRKGIWSLGFVTGVTKGEVQKGTNNIVLNVFIPTTPNPTSGYLLFIPKEDIKHLKMSVEEGIKMVISAGIITPE